MLKKYKENIILLLLFGEQKNEGFEAYKKREEEIKK